MGTAITPPRGVGGAAPQHGSIEHSLTAPLLDGAIDPPPSPCSGSGQTGDGIHFELTRLTGPGPGTPAGPYQYVTACMWVLRAHASGTPDAPKTASRSSSRRNGCARGRSRERLQGCLPPRDGAWEYRHSTPYARPAQRPTGSRQRGRNTRVPCPRHQPEKRGMGLGSEVFLLRTRARDDGDRCVGGWG
jgi:hypothetical protein